MVELQKGSRCVSAISIDDIMRIIPLRPTATTRERGWGGVTVDLYGPLSNRSESYPALDHHVISYFPSGRVRMIQRRAGETYDAVMSAGDSLLMPAGHPSEWEGDSPATARLRIPCALISSAAKSLDRSGPSLFEIRNVFEMRDPFVERVALTLLGEMKRTPHPAQALIVDTVSCALAAHLLRSHTPSPLVEAGDAPPLSRRDIARLNDFIRDNIDRPVRLADLAGIVKVSRFHFARIFKRSMGCTALAFVEQCRIDHARALIADSDIPLAAIALMTGFADQSHFTRRFRKHTGLTPGAYGRAHSRYRSARPGAG